MSKDGGTHTNSDESRRQQNSRKGGRPKQNSEKGERLKQSSGKGGQTLIKWCEEIGAADAQLVGGKGANLGELIKTGLSVPKCFCITTEAFQQFIDQPRLYDSILRLVAGTDVYDIKNLQRHGARIRGLIVDAEIPSHVTDAILTAYHRLCAVDSGDHYGFVAVRSSTTAEDMPEVSFAGQHETFLGVSGDEQLMHRIKDCWASLWADRVIAYREKKKLDHSRIFISVVIQKMIESETAGVMFTVNPVTGNEDEIVIEANLGLGESVVSGKIVPDRFVVSKKTGDLLSQRVAEKTSRVVIDRTGERGTLEEAVLAGERTKAALSDKQVTELAGIGRRLEEHFGAPQDVEWGILRDKIYILQSRPATAIGAVDEVRKILTREVHRLKKLANGKEIVWSDMFFAELLPTPTPLSFDFAGRMAEGVFNAFDTLGVGDFRGIELPILVVCGRSYFNVNEVAAMSVMQGLPVENKVLELLSGDPAQVDFEKMYVLKKLNLVDVVKAPLYLVRGLAFGLRIIRFIRNYDRMYREEILPPYQEYLSEIRGKDYAEKSEEELLSTLRDLFAHAANEPRKWWELGNVMSFITYGWLDWIIKHWNRDPTVAPELIKGMPGNKTLETNIEIWKLSEQAKELSDVFLGHKPEDIGSLLAESDKGRQLIENVRVFLETYGHRVCGELELANRRWRDDPSFVYGVIQKYLLTKSPNPVEQFAEQKKNGDEVAREVERHLSSGILNRILPFKKMMFRRALKRARTYAPYRETPKFYFLMEFAVIRDVALEIGRRFVGRGALAEANDVFYFDLGEIGEVVRSIVGADEARRLALVRKREREIGLTIDLPTTIFSSELDELGKPNEQESAMVLSGIPVSPGTSTGPARIINDPSEFSEIQSGEIMVAGYIDPSWTSLFLTIKGMVLEVGTVLSHGAIAAREYNLPGIANVRDATKIIKNGQKITVDGNTGRVLILGKRE
jgi:pyruvate,water dikinase